MESPQNGSYATPRLKKRPAEALLGLLVLQAGEVGLEMDSGISSKKKQNPFEILLLNYLVT